MLDEILHSALQEPNVRAIILFDDFFTPLAGRGAFNKPDIQHITHLISRTDVGTVGQITLDDGRLAQFHYAETHTVVLIKCISSSPESINHIGMDAKSGTTIGSPSSISTARATLKEHQHNRGLSSAGSKPIFAPGTSLGLSISNISASVETIKAGTNGKPMKSSLVVTTNSSSDGS